MQNKFIEHEEIVRGLAPLTVKNYRTWLATIKNSISVPLEKIDKPSITGFITTARKNKLSPKTINLHLIVLRSFLKYCREQKVRTMDPESVELLRVTEKKIDIIDQSDIEKLFLADLPTREKALIEILFSTGLRINELKQLKVENVRWDEKSITIIGKGGKERLVFVSDRAIDCAKNYLKDRISGFIFPETVRTLQRSIQFCAESAGIAKRVTPHMIRHIFATDLLQNGASIYDVKKLLGHSNISTTERYLHVSNEHLKDQFNKFHATRR